MPQSHNIFNTANATVKRTAKIINGCEYERAILENKKLKPNIMLGISAAKIPNKSLNLLFI